MKRKEREYSLGDALKSFQDRSGMTHKLLIMRTLRNWPEFAGKAIAEQTKRLRYDKGVLLVYMDSPVWRQELNYRKSEILERINTAAGKRILKGIKVY